MNVRVYGTIKQPEFYNQGGNDIYTHVFKDWVKCMCMYSLYGCVLQMLPAKSDFLTN